MYAHGVRRATGLVPLVALTLAVGCEGPPALVVTLRTDWIAGQEVVQISTDVDRARTATAEVTFGDDLGNGRRVAEVTGLAPGEHEVTVTLTGPEPGMFTSARRLAVVDARGAGSVTVVMTRDCQGVHCPIHEAASACLGGRCVLPDCTPERPERCPTPRCVEDSDCPRLATCGGGVCAGGVCLLAPDDDACADGERCDPAVGCRPIDVIPLTAGAPVVGRAHACASRMGMISCWGSNLDGALGPHREARAHRAVPITGADLFRMAAGDDFTCMLEAGQSVLCWGDPSTGARGPGMSGFGLMSVPDVFAATGELASGTGHVCVGRWDGLRCWGRNDAGQASPEETRDPAPPTTLALDVGGLALGERHSCVLDYEGMVRCWGANDAGQLGDGTEVDRRTPAPVVGLRPATMIAATSRLDSVARSTTCAIVEGGAVECWGDGSLGQLGGATRTFSSTPVRIDGLPPVERISAGAATFCAGGASGVWCWGRNADGELGLGTRTPFEATPVHAVALDRFGWVSLGHGFGCGGDGGHVWCWGDNRLGQVTGREGAPETVLVPEQVLLE